MEYNYLSRAIDHNRRKMITVVLLPTTLTALIAGVNGYTCRTLCTAYCTWFEKPLFSNT
ncbi:MAG: hypothetical protein LBC20_10115 [Planctomycetaceae bacterium]|nr:hypothetical protein [Planctomycetaceae bacterium]